MNNTTPAKNPQSQGELAICERRIFASGGIVKRTEFEVTTPAVIDGMRIENTLVAGPFATFAEASAALIQAGAA